MSTSLIANLFDVLADPEHVMHRERRGKYQSSLALVGKVLGTKGIGINMTVVPPRSAAFPRHYHFVADELFVVLEGSGTLHYGEADYPLRPMDVISIQGGTGIPFQIENSSDLELRYLALSTMEQADVFHYPDSGKYGIMARGVPFRDLSGVEGLPRFSRFVPSDVGVGYYDGEPDAQE